MHSWYSLTVGWWSQRRNICCCKDPQSNPLCITRSLLFSFCLVSVPVGLGHQRLNFCQSEVSVFFYSNALLHSYWLLRWFPAVWQQGDCLIINKRTHCVRSVWLCLLLPATKNVWLAVALWCCKEGREKIEEEEKEEGKTGRGGRGRRMEDVEE